VQKFKGYVYENVTWTQDGKSLEDHEISRKKGHKYLMLVSQIDEGGRHLLFVAQERTKESLDQFFRILKADNGKAKLTIKKAC
jgi:hypothetical protein